MWGDLMEISKRLYDFIFNILVSVIMSIILSGAMLAVNVGIGPGFLLMWVKSFFVGLVFAVPSTYFAIGVVRRVMPRLFSIKGAYKTMGGEG